MNSYELLLVVKADMEDEQREALFTRFQDIIKNDGGEIGEVDEWGKRKLAYPINYINDGYYILMNFKANPDLPTELERNFRISEDVMRFMITKKDEE